jgi:hypothetical protein
MTNRIECEFEAQVLASVLEGRWPLAVEPDLREHVSQCGLCSTVAGMADLFAAANHQSQATATLPDASRVWWMAQIRARREATVDAGRPILATQLAACAWIIGLLFVCCGVALTWFQSTRGWMESALSLLLSHGPVIVSAAAIVVVLPAAAYFAMGKE